MFKNIIRKLIYSSKFSSKVVSGLYYKLGRYPNKYLHNSKSVLHIGGNTGQERHLYDYLNLNVAFIEPIPHVFQVLAENLKGYRKQRAYSAFFHNDEGLEFNLKIASNYGSSSSIYDLADHKELWPDVSYVSSCNVVSTTVDNFLDSKVWPFFPDTLILDVQGSELEVLKGAKRTLKYVKWVQVEASNFEAYAGGCLDKDIEVFLEDVGFCKKDKVMVSSDESGQKNYYELIYSKRE